MHNFQNILNLPKVINKDTTVDVSFRHSIPYYPVSKHMLKFDYRSTKTIFPNFSSALVVNIENYLSPKGLSL